MKRGKKSDRFKEFLAEAEDILNNMGKGLLKLGKGVKAGVIDPAVLNSIFRSAHTMKGISGIFDFKDMAALSHALEDTLDMLRLDRVTLNDEVLDCVMGAHELLVRIVASEGKKDFNEEVSKLRTHLAGCCEIKQSGGGGKIAKELLSILTEYEEHRLRENLKEGRRIFIVTARYPITSFDKGYAELTELLKTESEVIATLPSSKTAKDTIFFDILIATDKELKFITDLAGRAADTEVRMLSEPARETTRKSRPAELLDIKREVQRDEASETYRRVSNTVRVDIDKLDNIMNIISELGILKSSVTRLSAELKNESKLSYYGLELSRVEKYLERKFGELRDGVLDVRMVQIGQLFNRFDTFIDKLSRETRKEIRIVTNGGETELDKLIVEELADPLMHIIRNIVDHALETPSVREASGKSRVGTVTLSAYQKGNHVVVEIEDDGAGIDEEFVKGKAIERGLIGKKEAEELSRHEILELIFMPGFTTRDVVSKTSGRGVGMDVVKENITRLSGIIDIDTAKGKGTRFVLTIPVTLAIIQALIVEEDRTRYAVPMNSVIEISDLSGCGRTVSGSQEFIMINNRKVPSVRLSGFFGRPHGYRPLGTPNGDACYGIVAGLAEQRVCLVVDHLLEELDVVIKPLPRIIRVPGIAGATDMGEKGTILVLDVTGILEHMMKERKPFARVEPSG